jgi:ABC-type bacteriocin/lantibiotic exporter with double-glycine peptidase domain
MYQVLLFTSLGTAVLAFFLCLLSHARVNKINRATKELDWEAVANITGDLATVKKTVQTLNNRLNGMHSSKITDEDLIRQFAQQQQTKPNGRMIGG